MNSSVSVIIPAYNSAASVCRTIDSALAQNLKPHEVIVINDGSTDNTAEVAQSYGDKIIYIEQDNQGQGSARNAGLKVATGRFIAFLDADDYWLPGFLKRCVGFLEEHQEAVAVSTGIIVKRWKKPDRYWPPINSEDENFNECVLADFFRFWASYDHVRTGASVIRREIIEKAGYQRDLRVSQDLEYWAYIATFGKWGFIPEHLWIGDSCQVASKQGWLKKYHKRRKLCPTVEQWEQRLLSRIEEDIDNFCIIRGRVAIGYAHNHILGGNRDKAFHIVNKYGSFFPRNKLSKLMLIGAKFGFLGWYIACCIMIIKERMKDMRW